METFYVILGIYMLYAFTHSAIIAITRSKTIYEKIVTISGTILLVLFIIWSTV